MARERGIEFETAERRFALESSYRVLDSRDLNYD